MLIFLYEMDKPSWAFCAQLWRLDSELFNIFSSGFSGIKAEDKRGGGGKGNWGTMDDEMKGKVSDLSFLIVHKRFESN